MLELPACRALGCLERPGGGAAGPLRPLRGAWPRAPAVATSQGRRATDCVEHVHVSGSTPVSCPCQQTGLGFRSSDLMRCPDHVSEEGRSVALSVLHFPGVSLPPTSRPQVLKLRPWRKLGVGVAVKGKGVGHAVRSV